MPVPRSRIVVQTRQLLTKTCLDELARTALDQIGQGGRPAVVVTGGSIGEAMFPEMVTAPLDWSQVDLFWTGERMVPPDHPDSNYAQAERLFLRHVPVDRARVHQMPAYSQQPEAAAQAYEQLITDTVGRPPVFDFVLLGVGSDGHICSLFPGHRALSEDKRFVVAVHDSPKTPKGRMTLTLPAIDLARAIVVMALGREKAAVIADAVNDPQSTLPVSYVARMQQTLLLLDHAAASKLGNPSRLPSS